MNQTIYFRKDIWESFQDEPEKSSLVNELLAKHYGKPTLVDPIIRVKPLGVVKAPDAPAQPLKKEVGANLCKIHGTPLTVFGKCLMKGCKYA